MRSILFYYSDTGNTQLTVDSIQKSLPSTDLWEWKGEEYPELDNYELIGFAFPTYKLSLPPQVRTRLLGLDYSDTEGNKNPQGFRKVSCGISKVFHMWSMRR